MTISSTQDYQLLVNMVSHTPTVCIILYCIDEPGYCWQ